jgi:hypothetical protein
MRRFLILPLALVGCGDDGNSGRLADAPTGSIDAPTDAAGQPDAPVTWTVTNSGLPVPGVRVHFLGSDDAMVATVNTEAAGTASAVVAAGGSVTALDPFLLAGGGTAPDDIRTFAGVVPGDHLVLTGSLPLISFTRQGTAVPGAVAYDVVTSCGSGSISAAGGSGSGSPDPRLAAAARSLSPGGFTRRARSG